MRLFENVAGVLVLWLLILAMGGGVIWLARGFDELGQLMMLGFAVVSLVKAIQIGRGYGARG